MKIVREPLPLSTWYRPSETPRYCHECRQTKPFAGHYCLECATKHKEFDDSLVMPRPFLRATTMNFCIQHLLSGSRLEWAPPLAEGERRLGWLTLPPFQRPPVWSAEQKVRFIESIWLGLPIGAYAYNDPEAFKHPTTNWLLDGQQRVTAIMEYATGSFEVFGYRFPDLPKAEQCQFENTPFPAIVTRDENPDYLAEIYDRLAYGGTAHEPKETT